MSDPLEEKEKNQILNTPPIGTWILMLMIGAGMVLAWLFIYFGVFMPRGAVQ
ncbi:MAG: hypothetical protein Kow0060_12230 [Methylohalobius crimeensis]